MDNLGLKKLRPFLKTKRYSPQIFDMARISKKRKAAEALVDSEKQYPLNEAMALIKKVNTTKFDASVDLHIRLGIDPRKADQALRGTVSLPHGTGKKKTVMVFCTPDKEAEAKAAGADYVGLDDLVTKVQGGFTDVDAVVAMPSTMAVSYTHLTLPTIYSV